MTKIAPPLTTEDLLALPDDDNIYELIEGEIIVSRTPTLTHQRILINLTAAIKNYLEQNPIGQVFPTPGVIFDKNNSVIPDVVLLTSEQLARTGSKAHIHEATAHAVEIVSPGRENARRDRVAKLGVYDKFGVGEYRAADLESRSIEIYRRAEGALALTATLTGDDEITSALLPGFACGAGKVFAN